MKARIRKLLQRIPSQRTSDGDGVRIQRIAGSQWKNLLDPFLLLDEIGSNINSDYIGGFPSHPHRGFETVTYMLQGRMRHRDHLGNEGLLKDGDVQWMTAGRGVIHSEMPEQTDGQLHGFQLWLNLRAREKMKPAHYQHYRADQLPLITSESGGSAKVIAGTVNMPAPVQGPVKGVTTEPIYCDLELTSNEVWTQAVPEDHTVLLYIYQGSTTELSKQEMGVYSEGNAVEIIAGAEGAKALLLAARPLHEPVKQYGPFVMNTMEEIEQAIEDYKLGRLTG